MDTQEIEKIITRIDQFDKECEAKQHTDIGEAWEILFQASKALALALKAIPTYTQEREMTDDEQQIIGSQISQGYTSGVLSDIDYRCAWELKASIVKND